MKSLTVDAAGEHYEVLVGRLEDCRSRLTALAGGRPLVVVTEPKLWSLHGHRLEALLPCDPLMVPEGEAAKDWPHLQALIEGFTARNLDRSTAVAAFGGWNSSRRSPGSTVSCSAVTVSCWICQAAQ